jgi:hypothetical protein
MNVAPDPAPRSDQPDLRQVFTETCQMYRHYLLMRYYTLAALAVFQGVLLAAWFQKGSPLPTASAITLALAGVAVLAAVIAIDLRLTVIGAHLAARCDELAQALSQKPLLDAGHHKFGSVWLPSILLGVTLTCGGLGWILSLIIFLRSGIGDPAAAKPDQVIQMTGPTTVSISKDR